MPAGLEFDGRKPFSVELWVRELVPRPDFAFLVDHETTSAPGRRGWLVHTGAKSWNLELWPSPGGNQNVGVAAPPPGDWHHVVSTADGTTLRFYVDGQRVDQQVLALSVPAIAVSWTIGSGNCNCHTGLHGDLDEVAIYDSALSDLQIQKHYAAAGR
jgi:hypothetical protein